MTRRTPAALTIGALLLSAGCSSGSEGGEAQAAPTTAGTTSAAGTASRPTGEPRVAVDGLNLPWSLVRLENGSTLVSERDTKLVKEIREDGDVRTVGEVPGVVPEGEGGLLGLAVRDDDQATLYAYITAQGDNRVVRMPLTGEPGALRLGAPETVFEGMPKNTFHNGGRIKFGPDGMLYITAGDAGNVENSQDRSSLGGKILRVTPDGAVPDDNPFEGSPVYSYGHRNPQGIAWDDEGRLWAAEFGQNTWDELNAIEPGKNYGWPVVEGRGDDDRYVNPVEQWSTAEASPSGLGYVDGTFYLAALRGERLWAISPTSRSAAESEAYFQGGFGRLRDVVEGPEGKLWVLTNNTARDDPEAGIDKVLEIDLGQG